MKVAASFKKFLYLAVIILAFEAGNLSASQTQYFFDSSETLSFDRLFSHENFINENGDTPFYCQSLKSRHYISQLSPSLYKSFTQLYNTIQNFESVCYFTEPLTKDELEMLMAILHLDCPEIMQIESAAGYRVNISGKNVSSVHIPYFIDKPEYDKRLSECKAAVSLIVDSIPGDLPDYEKHMMAYDAICSKCTYDASSVSGGSAWGALVDGKAKCDGLSLSFKWVCDELGIKCMVISGNDIHDNSGHAWNNVFIDGDFYDLDLTSDTFHSGEYAPLYYAADVSTTWIRSNYSISRYLRGFDLPCSYDMSKSFHARNGTFIKAGASGEEVRNILFSGIGKAPFFMQFEDNFAFTDFIAELPDYMNEWAMLNKKSISHHITYSSTYRTVRFAFDY